MISASEMFYYIIFIYSGKYKVKDLFLCNLSFTAVVCDMLEKFGFTLKVKHIVKGFNNFFSGKCIS